MKVSANKIDEYIANQLIKVKAVLLYGPDVGLASERSEKITHKILGENPDPFLLVKFENKKLLEEKGVLADEANSMSLMPGKKLIIISDANNTIVPEIEGTLNNLKGDSFIVIKAGDLTTSSKLRKLAESRDDILSAPCYIDDQANLTNLVREKLNEKSYNYPHDLPQYIASFFSGNRLLLKVELDKLFIYLGDTKDINVDDIENIICSSKEESYQAITNSVASKDWVNTEKEIKRHIKHGVYPVIIIRALINYFSRLLAIKAQMDEGVNLQIAINNLRPPVFFKQKTLMTRHITFWHLKEIQSFLQLLERLEILFKSENAFFAEIILLSQMQKIMSRTS